LGWAEDEIWTVGAYVQAHRRAHRRLDLGHQIWHQGSIAVGSGRRCKGFNPWETAQKGRMDDINFKGEVSSCREPLDQNLRVVSRIGGSGLKEFLFNYRSREVPSVEGSCKHGSHPLGGDCVVDRWHNKKHPEKSGSG
jgi:hypothetical protein